MMQRTRTRRGSSLIFAVILITAITVFFVGAQELMMASVTTQQRVENRTKARLALESAAASVVSEFRHGLLTLPATRTVTVAGLSVTANVTDNSGAVARTMKVATSLQLKGQTFTDSIVVGQRVDPSPWNYALFVDSTQTFGATLTTGSLGSGGDTFLRNNAVGGSYSHTIHGDLESEGTISANFTVSGTSWTQAPPISFAVPSFPTYGAAADTNYWSSTMNGYAFTDYGASKTHLVYRVGDLDIRGAFTGNGVIYTTGNMDITGNITVTGGKLVLISDGDMRLKSNNKTVNAFLFCENATLVQNVGMTVVGALVTSSIDVNKDVTVIHDPYFWDNPSERARFKLPGYWP